MSVGYQQDLHQRFAAINFGGRVYLQAEISCSANNNAFSQDAAHAANASAALTLGDFGSISGAVWGEADGGVDLTGLDLNTQFPITKEMVDGIFASSVWDVHGQSPNVAIIPAPNSRVGGSASIILPLSLIKRKFTATANYSSQHTDSQVGTSLVFKIDSSAFVGISFVRYGKTYKVGKPFGQLSVKKELSGAAIGSSGGGGGVGVFEIDPVKVTVKQL